MIFVHYWGRHGSISGIQSGYQGFSALRFSPRGSGNPGIHQESEKKKNNNPWDTENTGQSQKIREKGRFLTELGIDRLHPEPKNDFLGLGSPKKGKNQQKTSKIRDFGVGGSGPDFLPYFSF